MTGALVLAPAAGAAAEETDVDSQVIVTPESENTSATSPETGAEAAEVAEPADPAESADRSEVPAAAEEPGTPATARAATTKAAEPAAADERAVAQKLAPASGSVKASMKITGSKQVGKKLRVKAAIKSPSKLAVKRSAYTWYANGKKVGTGSTYRLKAKDRGKRMSVGVSLSWRANGTYSSGTKSVQSSKTAKVKKAKASVKVSKVKITGSAKVGKKLTAKATVKKPKGLKVKGTYTWYVGGKKAKTGKTLRLKTSHAKKSIKVVYKAKWKSSSYLSGSKKKNSSKKKVGYSAAKIVSKARSQLGDHQDCTRLVERSLRATGVPAGDLGTQVSDYTKIGGKVVKASSAKPGDILVFPGQHVAVAIGKNRAVHGGFGGTTKIGGYAPGGETGMKVVRFA